MTNHMRASFIGRRVIFVLVLLSLCVPAPALAQSAQSGISILQNSVSTVFAEESVFHFEARSDSPIQEVALLYRVSGSVVTHRTYPMFAPGRNLAVEWTWQHYPGSLAPGSVITYYWLLWDETGREIHAGDASFTYVDDRFNWEAASEGPIHIHVYRDGQGADLMNVALNDLESLEEEIGVSLTQPIQIYVYANRSDMQLALPSRSDRYDEMTVTLGMVVADDTLLLLGNASGVEKTLAHELSHIVVGLATDNPISDLPRWLDEGLAMYAERDLPAANQQALDRAVRRDNLISVRSLSGYSGDPDLVDLFYAESYSLISFMLDEYGRDKMLELLTQFRQGVYQEDALLTVYGFGLDELDARWRKHLGLAPRSTSANEAEEPVEAADDRSGFCFAGLAPGMALATLFALCRPRAAVD